MTAAAAALSAVTTMDSAARYVRTLAKALPAGDAQIVVAGDKQAVAWCADHQSAWGTWCRNCTIHVVTEPGVRVLLAALSPVTLELLASWLSEASTRELNYQLGLEGNDDMPQPGEEAYDALRLARALLNVGSTGETTTTMPEVRDG